MPLASIGDTELFYEIDGDGTGPPCFVLHGGLGVDHVPYRRTLAPLADDRTIVYVDHRGNGRSGRPPVSTITMEQLADDVVELADHLGHDQFAVFGHSYGGFVAQELTLRHPVRVDRLVLVCTTPGQLGTGEDPAPYAGEPPPDDFVELISDVPETDQQCADGIAALAPHHVHGDDPSVLTRALEGTVFSASAMVRGFEVLSQWSSVDRLDQVRCPVLLMAGRHDLFAGFRQLTRIRNRLINAEVEGPAVFDQSGHFPWIEEPERFFMVIDDWLDRSDPPGWVPPGSDRSR
jgi:proline iminopeptidase